MPSKLLDSLPLAILGYVNVTNCHHVHYNNSYVPFPLRNTTLNCISIKVLEKCTKNLIGHSRLAFNNHESNIDC